MLLKKTIYPLVSMIYQLLCVFTPRFKNKIIFVSYPDAADNCWHIYRYILENMDGYNLIWLCSNKDKVEHKIFEINKYKSNNKIAVYNKFSLYGLLSFFTAAYVFHTHGTYFFVKKNNRVKIINLWHGMPIKAIGFLDGKQKHDVAYGDYLLSTSDFFSSFMSEAFAVPKENVLPFGLPRNDVLMLDNKMLTNDVYNILNIQKDNRIIFWLPTFRMSMAGDIRSDSTSQSFLDDWDENLFDHLDEIAKKKKVTVIIKIHPMDQLNFEQLTSTNNVRVIKSQEWQNLGLDLYDALSCSSGLISDVSSVLLDYICSNKPIAVTKSTKNQYTRKILFNLDDFSKECFVINRLDDLTRFISTVDSMLINYTLLRKYNAVTKNSIPEILNYFDIK